MQSKILKLLITSFVTVASANVAAQISRPESPAAESLYMMEGTVIHVAEHEINSVDTARVVSHVTNGHAGIAQTQGSPPSINGFLSLNGGVAGASAPAIKAYKIVVQRSDLQVFVIVQDQGKNVPMVGQKVLFTLDGRKARLIETL